MYCLVLMEGTEFEKYGTLVPGKVKKYCSGLNCIHIDQLKLFTQNEHYIVSIK